MKRFEVLDIFGDAGIRASGHDLNELFANAALGMYSLITDPSSIRNSVEVEVFAEGRSLEGLLVSWLNELVFRFDTYGFLCCAVKVNEFVQSGETYSITATASGEEFDPERHERRLLIKAATYHQLKIERAGEIWSAEIIFDI